MYLSALSPVIALPVALYSLITATLLLILCPLCLCLEHWSFDARFHSLLSPPLVFQLRLIYSSYDTNVPADLNATRVIMLLLFNLFTPIYAMTIAVAAWVAAVFWFYTAILGNPDGSKEDRDDGREAVFGVRKWWETWLIQGLA